MLYYTIKQNRCKVMNTEKQIFDLLNRGYSKQQIVTLIKGLTMNQLTYIMRKRKWGISKNTKSYAIHSGRKQYTKKNVITRSDKNYKLCPFLGVNIHHKNNITKNTVYVVAITYNGKRHKKASNNLIKILHYRDDFYKQYCPEKLKIIKKKELKWFLTHPFSKYCWVFVKYKLIKY